MLFEFFSIMTVKLPETDANSIIKAVMEKTNNEYQVEVKFISET